MNLLHHTNKRPIFLMKVGPDKYEAYYTDCHLPMWFDYEPTPAELAKAEAELALRDKRA